MKTAFAFPMAVSGETSGVLSFFSKEFRPEDDDLMSYINETVVKVGMNLEQNMTFDQLIDEINPKRIIGLSTQGVFSSCEDVAKKLSENSCIVIGGFPKGNFSDLIKKRVEYLVNVNKSSLESHIVVSRILYEYEKTIFM